MSPARVSHERVFLDAIRAELEGIPNAEVFSGLKPENRYELKGWELSLIQRFQFDDLRVELPDCAVVIEAESAGGVGNLVKYWPLLRDGSLDKRFVLGLPVALADLSKPLAAICGRRRRSSRPCLRSALDRAGKN